MSYMFCMSFFNKKMSTYDNSRRIARQARRSKPLCMEYLRKSNVFNLFGKPKSSPQPSDRVGGGILGACGHPTSQCVQDDVGNHVGTNSMVCGEDSPSLTWFPHHFTSPPPRPPLGGIPMDMADKILPLLNAHAAARLQCTGKWLHAHLCDDHECWYCACAGCVVCVSQNMYDRHARL